MQAFPLFCCLGRALVRYGGNAIGFGILGDVAVKVGQEVWNAWNKEKNEAQRRAELQEIARAAAQECRAQVEEVIRDVAADQPAEIRRQIANYLNQVPELIRQSLRRPEDPEGQTVPPGLSLQRSEDLLPFLALEQLAPTAPAEVRQRLSAPLPTEEKARPTVTLTVIHGGLKGQKFVFRERNTCLLGRADDCEPRIPNDEAHRRISRHHCLLDINPPAVCVRDFGSMNGTYVNKELIGQRPKGASPEEGAKLNFRERDLQQGDIITLDDTALEVCIERPAVCRICFAEIADRRKIVCEITPGAFECEKCQQIRKAKPPAMGESGKACCRCGRDVSAEIGRHAGEMICAACKADPLQLAKHLLALANSGKDGASPLAGYRLVRELGRGGMGAVFLLARDASAERLALKLMLPRVAADATARARFLREIEVTKSLCHRHVVQLRDFGNWQEAFYFTLEYCDGGSVDHLMKERGGKLPVDEAVEIILQALTGLEYAHNLHGPGKGLVHRDLSPHNLFLAGQASTRLTKIGDYGLAKAFDLAGLSGQTRTGEAAGKPYFMPRQQVVNFKYAQPAVDVWAMAACFYAMLTGAVPKDFPKGRDPWLAVLESDAVPVRKHNPQVPTKLAAVIDQALVDRPAIGFLTAADFKDALEASL